MPPAESPASGALTLRERVLAGEQVVGLMVVEFFTPALPGILARAGVDFAVFDMETSSLTFERFEMLAALSRGVGLAPLVRVPSPDPDLVGRCLDLGAVGVMAPKLANVEDAAAFVASTRYPPTGTRGSGYQAFPSGYVRATSAADRAAADDTILTICQLETRTAIEDAPRIAALPGVDVLNVGANDLAAELGVTPGDPEVVAAVASVRELCVEHGKGFLGREGGDPPANGPERRMVLIDHDTAALSAHTAASVRALRKEPTP